MRSLAFVLPLALTFGLVGPAIAETAAAATDIAATATQIAPAITVSVVEKRVLRDRVIASGLISAIENVQVAPLIEGQPIEALLVDIGDVVEVGQVLAVLSKSTLELQKSQFNASLASARATVAQAEAQMLEARSSADEAQRVSQRTSALRQQGTASQAAADTSQANAISATARVTVAVQSLEAARAQVALVEAQMANIDLQLSRTEVKAPVSGEVTARNARVGSIASAAGEPMFTIIRDNALEVLADVAEADIMRLAPGQTAHLRLVGASEPLTGTLRMVEPTIGVASRLGRVRIAVDDETGVRSGMYVEAEILVAEHDVIAVPVTAVGSGPDGTSVMKVTGDSVSRLPVQTGIRDGGWVEILSGLTEADVVVTKAGAFVRDGDRINPIPAMN
ncbi:MAG: efflux RND transporter periplasmic adaptor subunit [Pseudotabrizicola sp.]|uniref:efflux RND transporter periplasmic adaptor subunit n=1 Tax=Pseudotabrizicola sp. TaxID=2939647 RepID=UPI0027182BE5|nr:efflux RND transporter periplasmic adaptor subunit [Pseudotabrizicola sp.]MDO8883580.1 efflux RND transporter periplasmic adaptor subunit [Pseudotabrizicola sp.]MDP2081233.1 efflux RND transporter periplasmic adaptor subunit [Pseudotabrizicola sp.]MDZ7576148.1 efflux RND transporter periplasmic adaptor subunit [Pseudotabrizicola sp.]